MIGSVSYFSFFKQIALLFCCLNRVECLSFSERGKVLRNFSIKFQKLESKESMIKENFVICGFILSQGKLKELKMDERF